MAAHVIAVTATGGVPLFNRRKGNTENLPFSAVGALNGVHIYSKAQQIQLLNTLTEDYSVVWQEYHDSILLMGIATGCTEDILRQTVDAVFSAMVLMVGLQELQNQRNTERLKRELRIAHPIIDRLLDSLDCGDANSSRNASDLVALTETILCPENHLIKNILDSFTECVDSLYCCVLVHGKVCACTDSWWSLHPQEIKLLTILAGSESKTAMSKDVPVFLPHKSPMVPFRFVCCLLMPDVQLCCLCGPTPSLGEVEKLATQSFRNTADTLGTILQCHPRNFQLYSPNAASSLIGNQADGLDGAILGLLLVHTIASKYMISRSPQLNTNTNCASSMASGGKGKSSGGGSSSHRLDILRTFYYQNVCKFFARLDEDCSTTTGLETYWCSEYHKCYAMRLNEHILCVLFNATVPTHAMRFITEKTLKMLLHGEKQSCW